MQIKITDIRCGVSKKTKDKFARLDLSFYHPDWGGLWQQIKGAMLYTDWIVRPPALKFRNVTWHGNFGEILGNQIRDAKIQEIEEHFDDIVKEKKDSQLTFGQDV